jgi:hypothetical protein
MKFSHCSIPILFMTYIVQAFKLGFRAYKILGICVSIVCMLSLENE